MENPLTDMIDKLFKKEGLARIPFKQIVKSFSKIGEVYPMGDGKTITPISINEKEILIKVYMPKGTKYPPNEHEDAHEKFTIITGKIRNPLFRLTKGKLGQFSWRAGTPHDLVALEDTVAYALITKID